MNPKRMFGLFNRDSLCLCRPFASQCRNEMGDREEWLKVRKAGFSVRPVLVTFPTPKRKRKAKGA